MNIRVYNTDGKHFYNIYDVDNYNERLINWEDVEYKLPDGVNLEHLTNDFSEITDEGYMK